jgi:hypothetical protein
MFVPMSGDFHAGRLQHLALAGHRVAFRGVVRADKHEQRKGCEYHDEYPAKFPFHGLRLELTS